MKKYIPNSIIESKSKRDMTGPEVMLVSGGYLDYVCYAACMATATAMARIFNDPQSVKIAQQNCYRQCWR